ncbi:FecCD transport family protein [Streptomyces sp. yr375]|nr:FecCD transport family protein [Streptomyces sp. yr375]
MRTLLGSRLKVLKMGDDVAGSLGVPGGRARCPWAGPIPFVALVTPQLARRLTRVAGPNLAAATCTGTVLVVTADFASQRVHETAQLPVGVVTGVVGGLYLALRLRHQRRAGRI